MTATRRAGTARPMAGLGAQEQTLTVVDTSRAGAGKRSMCTVDDTSRAGGTVCAPSLTPLEQEQGRAVFAPSLTPLEQGERLIASLCPLLKPRRRTLCLVVSSSL